MKLLPVALAGLLLVATAPLALTAGPLDRWSTRGEPSADTPPFQALEPCKYGHLPGEGLYAEGFSTGAAGWTAVRTVATRPNLWHWTTFAGNNSALDHLGHGDAGRLYYGMENAFGGTFNTDPITNEGDYRSPGIAIPAGSIVAVNLNTKWHVEWDRPTIYDGMMLGYVDTATGQRTLLCFFGPWIGERVEPGIGYYINSPTGAWLISGCKPYPRHDPVCNYPETEGELKGLLGVNPTHFDLANVTNFWEPRSFNLPASVGGKTIQLVFYFREGDALINDATGWMIDDVAVVKVA